MKATALACFAIIILLIILVIVFLNKRNKESFEVSPERKKEAVNQINNDLDCIVNVAKKLNESESIINSIKMETTDDAIDKSKLFLHGIKTNMVELIKGITILKQSIDTNYNYKNSLSLYRGLCNSDVSYKTAADALEKCGIIIQDQIRSDYYESRTEESEKMRRELANSAALLLQLSSCFYSLTKSIHYLGSALNME